MNQKVLGRWLITLVVLASLITPAPVWAGTLDVQVNNPIADIGLAITQSGTSLRINPLTGTVCSTYNDSQHWATGYTGFSRSNNDGASFEDRGGIPSGGGGISYGYPTLIWRHLDNFFYLGTLHSQGIGLWRSSNDCQDFSYAGLIFSGGMIDKPMMAADNHPSSPYYGRVYTVFTDFSNGHIYVTFTDNMTTWSTPADISLHNWVNGAWPAIAPNGDLYVGWVHWDTFPAGPIDIEIVRSTNGGSVWSYVNNPVSNVVNPREAAATTSCGKPALKGNIRYTPWPQLAVGPDHCLHIVYSYDPDGYNTGAVVNVYYRRSCDQGINWDPEIRLPDDATLTDKWSPTLSVGDNNTVVAAWYDRRNDQTNNLSFDYYLAWSEDGGRTWGPNKRLTDISSPLANLNPNFDSRIATCFHGDYDQQIQSGRSVYLNWSDDRHIQSGRFNPDVWFEKIVLGYPVFLPLLLSNTP